VDVSELPATAILASDDTVLARSLRQVIRSLDDPNGVIAAFDSFASDE
jgi:FXSXX-COOH protein